MFLEGPWFMLWQYSLGNSRLLLAFLRNAGGLRTEGKLWKETLVNRLGFLVFFEETLPCD